MFWDWVKDNAGKLGGAISGGATFGLTGAGLGAAMGSQGDNARSRQPAAYDPNQFYAGMPTAPSDVISGSPGYDRTGISRFENEAFRTGPSTWAKLSGQQQQMNADAARNKGTAEVDSQYAKGMDDLAMNGGLTSGARERAATSAGRNQIGMSQDVGKQQADNLMQIGINDEQNRISQLSQVPGMELGAANFDLSRENAQNEFNWRNYDTRMKGWAAGQQANAEDPRNPQSPNYDDGKRWYNPFSW